jgi:hypothetical protein
MPTVLCYICRPRAPWAIGVKTRLDFRSRSGIALRARPPGPAAAAGTPGLPPSARPSALGLAWPGPRAGPRSTAHRPVRGLRQLSTWRPSAGPLCGPAPTALGHAGPSSPPPPGRPPTDPAPAAGRPPALACGPSIHRPRPGPTRGCGVGSPLACVPRCRWPAQCRAPLLLRQPLRERTQGSLAPGPLPIWKSRGPAGGSLGPLHFTSLNLLVAEGRQWKEQTGDTCPPTGKRADRWRSGPRVASVFPEVSFEQTDRTLRPWQVLSVHLPL